MEELSDWKGLNEYIREMLNSNEYNYYSMKFIGAILLASQDLNSNLDLDNLAGFLSSGQTDKTREITEVCRRRRKLYQEWLAKSPEWIRDSDRGIRKESGS